MKRARAVHFRVIHVISWVGVLALLDAGFAALPHRRKCGFFVPRKVSRLYTFVAGAPDAAGEVV